jgi:hypothetical protein
MNSETGQMKTLEATFLEHIEHLAVCDKSHGYGGECLFNLGIVFMCGSCGEPLIKGKHRDGSFHPKSGIVMP